jgi:hypothetical protein
MSLSRILFTSLLAFGLVCSSPLAAEEIKDLIAEMMTAFGKGSQGVNGPEFQEKVNAVDQHLREKLERDNDLAPMKELVAQMQKFKARASARAMFDVVMQKVKKRLQFSKAQQDIKDPEILQQIDEMAALIDRCLDPNLPDDDTVNRKKIEKKRKNLEHQLKQGKAAFARLPDDKKFSFEILDEKGSPTKLPQGRYSALLAKIKHLLPDPEKLKVSIQLRANSCFDMRLTLRNFAMPSGFAVVEGEMEFVNVSLAALDNSDATNVEGLFDDNHFKRYRAVQTDEQINILPQAGETAYEMGTIAPGQSYKMDFTKTQGISAIMKDCEGHADIAIVNAKTVVADKAIDFKNTGSHNLMYLQGTDMTGLVSVKAIGTLKAKNGYANFQEVLLVVDDELASDLTRFIGGEGINAFIKAAAQTVNKGLPFTPVLENIACERQADGKMIYVFTGRGKNSL